MHWIQTIRENLALSQEELARYLRLSVHTIISAENERRQLPLDSLATALNLFNAAKDCHMHPAASSMLMKTGHEHRTVEGDIADAAASWININSGSRKCRKPV